jgi:hypothetical protein
MSCTVLGFNIILYSIGIYYAEHIYCTYIILPFKADEGESRHIARL